MKSHAFCRSLSYRAPAPKSNGPHFPGCPCRSQLGADTCTLDSCMNAILVHTVHDYLVCRRSLCISVWRPVLSFKAASSSRSWMILHLLTCEYYKFLHQFCVEGWLLPVSAFTSGAAQTPLYVHRSMVVIKKRDCCQTILEKEERSWRYHSLSSDHTTKLQ